MDYALERVLKILVSMMICDMDTLERHSLISSDQYMFIKMYTPKTEKLIL